MFEDTKGVIQWPKGVIQWPKGVIQWPKVQTMI